jgi:hypothetical protein
VNVYVESNFVLELVLEQEGCSACEELLALSEAKRISLRVPAYALLEPWETVARRKHRWAELGQGVVKELRQFERTAAISAEAKALRDLTVKASQYATTRLETFRARVLATARVLPIDAGTLLFADQLRQRFPLELPDAVMLAAVLDDLDGSDALFVNRNRKDFDDPDIQNELGSRGCTVKWAFDAALNQTKQKLSSAG